MDARTLRISFVVLLAALAATFLLSVAAGVTTGYAYSQDSTQAAYPALVIGLAPVLGAAVLALLLTTHALRTRISGIEQALLRFLDSIGGWTIRGWDEELEQALTSGADLGQYGEQGAAIQEVLLARSELVRLKAWAVRLFALPVLGLALIVGLSLWAIPASEVFLLSQVALNTTLLFFTSYGTFVATASLFAAFFLVQWE